jgi:hypothetical protein
MMAVGQAQAGSTAALTTQIHLGTVASATPSTRAKLTTQILIAVLAAALPLAVGSLYVGKYLRGSAGAQASSTGGLWTQVRLAAKGRAHPSNPGPVFLGLPGPTPWDRTVKIQQQGPTALVMPESRAQWVAQETRTMAATYEVRVVRIPKTDLVRTYDLPLADPGPVPVPWGGFSYMTCSTGIAPVFDHGIVTPIEPDCMGKAALKATIVCNVTPLVTGEAGLVRLVITNIIDPPLDQIAPVAFIVKIQGVA